MGKLKPLDQITVIKILESNGFKRIISRKHITFKKKIQEEKILTTWVPHHRKITVFVILKEIVNFRRFQEKYLGFIKTRGKPPSFKFKWFL